MILRVDIKTLQQMMGDCFPEVLWLPVFTPGQIGDERYGHAHVDPCSNSDGQHSQEEGPPGRGAGLVEVTPRHSPTGLEGVETRSGGG